jgi:hypothetical protein
MLNRIIAATATALAVGTAGLAIALPASAQNGLTDAVHIAGNYDNGNHGPWASLDYTRFVKITPGTAANEWSVSLKDQGTFRTLKGKNSPGAGTKIENARPGTFVGTFDFKVTSTTAPTAAQVQNNYNYACNVNGTGDRAADCPGMPKSTSEWPALYFPGGTVTAGTWNWVYRTSREKWTNGNAGDTGDITGKGRTKTATAVAPVVRQPSCLRSGRLTVTGVAGVAYSLKSGDQVTPLTADHRYRLQPGRYLVSATALDGYKLRGEDSWFVKLRAARHCDKTAEAKAPAVKQPGCRSRFGQIEVYGVEGVEYALKSGWHTKTVSPGHTYFVRPGKHVVTAKALDGFSLSGEDSWTITINNAPRCNHQ